MIKSMTGYGRGEAILHGRPITVELRSVNNRYLDCSVKLPRIFVFAEDAIKTRVQQSISRGKVDVFVTVGPSEAGDVNISVNRPIADGYYNALCALRDSYELKDDISVSMLSRLPDVFLVEKDPEDLETVADDLCEEMCIRDRSYPRHHGICRPLRNLSDRSPLFSCLLYTSRVRASRGDVSHPKSGAAMLAVRCGVPILPVYVPEHKRWFRRTPVVIGEPFMPTVAGRKGTQEEYESITADLMERIRSLGELAQ